MRITINVPDEIIRQLREHVIKEGKSLSSLIAEFIERGIKETKRRTARDNILRTAGRARIDNNALRMLDEMRSEDDRA